MPEKTRVLVFTTAYRPMIGGSEIALEEIVRRLPNIFFDILTLKHRLGAAGQENFENGCIHRIGFGNPLDKLLFPISGFICALKFRPKIMHAYQASYGAGAAVLYKIFFPRTKFILTLQEGKDLEKQNFLIRYFRRLILKKADVITVISNYLGDYARRTNHKAQIQPIPNGVDLERFRFSHASEENTVITVSRLVLKNGVGDLVEAVALVQKDISDVKLIIVGSGPLEKELKEKIKTLNLEQNVVMVGEQSPASVSGYLAEASIFVRPSLSEGLGSAFLEAMAAGLPVIGTPVGGIPDFLKDGETGFFCRVADPKDLAEKIIKILKDGQLRERITINAKALVAEKYDWNIIAEKFAQIYERVQL